jgi:hypothetical protein
VIQKIPDFDSAVPGVKIPAVRSVQKEELAVARQSKKSFQIHSNGWSSDQARIISGVSRKSKGSNLINVRGFVVVWYRIPLAIREHIVPIGI